MSTKLAEVSAEATPAKSTVSPAEFVQAWQGSDSIEEVVEKVGANYAAVASRAFNYRKRGVALKVMARKTSSRVDVEALNALIL